jgi:hypothetical protein
MGKRAKVAVEPTPLTPEQRAQIRYFQWMHAPVIHTLKTEHLRAALPIGQFGEFTSPSTAEEHLTAKPDYFSAGQIAG